MKNGIAVVTTADETVEIPKADLLAIIAGELRELNYWSLRALMGITLRSGNTDQREFSVLGMLRREDTMTRAEVNFLTAVGELDGATTVNKTRVNSFLNVFLTDRFFVTPVTASFYFDEFQNIDFRATPGAGIGYELLDRGSIDLDVELGVGYQYTEFISAADPREKTNDSAVLLLGLKLDSNLTSWLTLDASLRVEMGIPDVSETTSHLISIFSVDLYGPFTLDTTFTWDWVVDPVTFANGRTPKSHDLALIAGLGVEF